MSWCVDAIRLRQPMHVPVIDVVFAYGGTFLQSLIAVVFIRHNAYRQYPWFFAYTIYDIFQILVQEPIFIVQGLSRTYVLTVYSMQIVALALSLTVIYEVFTSMMRPYAGLNFVGKRLFWILSAVLVIVAILMVALGDGPGANRMAHAVFVTLRSIRMIQIGLLLSLFVLSRSLGLTWRSYSFGIALGYGTYAAIDFLLAAIRAEYGEAIWHIESLLSASAYSLALSIWLWYMLQPQEVAQPIRVIPYNDIAKWNEKLEELLKKKAA